MITMRLFAEEKRTGTIELLVTSPLQRYARSSWANGWRAVVLYAAMLGISLLSMADPVRLRQAGLEADRWSAIWACCCKAAALLAIGTFISTCTKNQIVAGVAGFAICLLLWVLNWVSVVRNLGHGSRDLAILSVHAAFRFLLERRARFQGHRLLPVGDFRRIVSDGALAWNRCGGGRNGMNNSWMKAAPDQVRAYYGRCTR